MKTGISFFSSGHNELKAAINQFATENTQTTHTKDSALDLVERISRAFRLAKSENLSGPEVSFGKVSLICRTLNLLENRIIRFLRRPPNALPENQLLFEEPLKQLIENAKRDLIAISLGSLNSESAKLLNVLKTTTNKVSNNIKNIMFEYSHSATNAGNITIASTTVVKNLTVLIKLLNGSRDFAIQIHRILNRENVDITVWPQDELRALQGTLRGFNTELYKLADSVAYFSEENDLIAPKIIYENEDAVRMGARSALDLELAIICLEEFKSVINDCKNSIEKMIKSNPDATIAILQAVGTLCSFLTDKNDFLVSARDAYDKKIEKNEEKLTACRDLIEQLETEGVATSAEIKAVTRRCIHLEEMCIEYDDLILEFELVASSVIFNEAEHFVEFIENRSQYKDFMDPAEFDQPLYPPQEHWLIAPARPQNEAEVLAVVDAFKNYSDTIKQMKLLFRSTKECPGISRTFADLDAKIASFLNG